MTSADRGLHARSAMSLSGRWRLAGPRNGNVPYMVQPLHPTWLAFLTRPVQNTKRDMCRRDGSFSKGRHNSQHHCVVLYYNPIQLIRFIKSGRKGKCQTYLLYGYTGEEHTGLGHRPDQNFQSLEKHILNLPGCPVVKNLPDNEGDMGPIPGPGRSHMLQSH